MSVVLNNIKNFWVEKITTLLVHKGVDAANLTEGADWEDKLRAEPSWRAIEDYAENICQDIYTKATANQSPFPNNNLPTLLNQLAAEGDGTTAYTKYWRIVWGTLNGFQGRYLNLTEVVRDKIGVDPDSGVPATDAAGNNILINGVAVPLWKYEINQKLPDGIKLIDIPLGLDLTDLLYRKDLFQEITSNVALADIITRGLVDPDAIDRYGYNWGFKVNTAKIQEYKRNANNLQQAENHIRTVLGLIPADPTPHNWHNQLAKKSDLDVATATIGTLQPKADNYDRIHTKLSGKVSDSELDNLLQQIPQCSHTDYNTIKQERDQLKADKENHSCDSKVQAKESEIITKIITDLGLATEREREYFRSSNHGN